MTVEEWRWIPGYEGRYDVSDQGRVRSWLGRGKPVPYVLRFDPNRHGYLHVRLSLDRTQTRHSVHQLVMLAFVGPRPEGLETRHRDGDHTNNARTNLIYGTPSENRLDAVQHGTHNMSAKTHCPQGHSYDDANTHITPKGDRRCATCNRERARTWRARHLV